MSYLEVIYVSKLGMFSTYLQLKSKICFPDIFRNNTYLMTRKEKHFFLTACIVISLVGVGQQQNLTSAISRHEEH
jgi:hypothetical protein